MGTHSLAFRGALCLVAAAALIALSLGCSSTPVAPDNPQRVSAATSGRETAESAEEAVHAARSDEGEQKGETESDNKRWIYATNMPESSNAETKPGSNAKDHIHPSSVRVKLLVSADGTVRSPSDAYDSPAAAAEWAAGAMERSGTDTIEVYVAADTPATPLDALLAALQNAEIPHISVVFAPPTGDEPADETE